MISFDFRGCIVEIKTEISMGFMEGGSFNGMQEINSMLPLQSYQLKIGDGIVFTSSDLEKALRSRSIVVFNLPNDWQHKHHIPATEYFVFFEILSQLIVTQKYEVRRNVLKNFLDTLCERNYLTSLQKAQYLETIPSSYEYLDMKEDATRYKNADLVLNMVRHLFEKKDYSVAIHWLSVAKEYNPDHDFFKNPANVQALLLQITNSLTINSLFLEEKHKWLLDQIAICPAIEKLYFGTFFEPHCINDRFEEFLSNALFIKTLHLGATWSANKRMKPVHVQYLARGLERNTSVQKIELCYQSIGDEGLIMIVEALKANPANKVVDLNLADTNLSGVGAAALLVYMQLHKEQIQVNLACNDKIPRELLENIDAVEKREKGQQMSLCFFSDKVQKLDADSNARFSTIEKSLAEKLGHSFFSLQYKGKTLDSRSTPQSCAMSNGEVLVVRNIQ